MTPLEDRVRRAIRDKAGEVPSDAVPPLRLPARRRRSFSLTYWGGGRTGAARAGLAGVAGARGRRRAWLPPWWWDLRRCPTPCMDGQHRARAQQAAAAVRNEAAAWVATQVSRSAVVSCDPVMCRALDKHAIPAGDLRELKPGTPGPLRSDVIVVTAAIRAEFGAGLNSVYAPGVIASFGSASTRIDIRVIAPQGAAAYRSALSADLAARKKAGPQLLLNSRISAPATARRQLTAGQVDSRLLLTLAELAAQQPVSIVTFGDLAPGASPGIPFRCAYLAEASGGASAGPAAQARRMSVFLHGLGGFFSSARHPDGAAGRPQRCADRVRGTQRARIAAIHQPRDPDRCQMISATGPYWQGGPPKAGAGWENLAGRCPAAQTPAIR